MGIAAENFAGGAAEQLSARAAEESLDRRADQHDARVAGEQHQAVLQFGHELIDVVFQRGKNLFAVAHLPAEIGDLQRDQTVFVVFRFVSRRMLRCEPAVTLSRLRLISFSGPRARFEMPAASNSETKIDAIEK